MEKHWTLAVDYRNKIIRGRCSDGRTFSQSFADLQASETLSTGWIAGFITAASMAGGTIEVIDAD